MIFEPTTHSTKSLTTPAIEVAQLNREDLGNLLEKSTVCISSVGPFSQHGEVVVEACIAQQTHYVDT